MANIIPQVVKKYIKGHFYMLFVPEKFSNAPRLEALLFYTYTLLILPFLIYTNSNYFNIQSLLEFITGITEQYLVSIILYSVIYIFGSFYLPVWITNLGVILNSLLRARKFPSSNELHPWFLGMPTFMRNRFVLKVIAVTLSSLTTYLVLFNFRNSIFSFPLPSLFLNDILSPATLILLFTGELVIFISIITQKLGEKKQNIDIPDIPLVTEEKFIEQRNILGSLVSSLDPEIKIQFFHSPYPTAYFNRRNKNVIQISDMFLQSKMEHVKHTIYHQFEHREQGNKTFRPILFLLTFHFFAYLLFTSLFWWNIIPPFLRRYRFFIVYYIVFLGSFFITRWLILNLEIEAETKVAMRMGKRDYEIAVSETLELLRDKLPKKEYIPGLGIDRFYHYSPLSHVFIYAVLKRIGSL